MVTKSSLRCGTTSKALVRRETISAYLFLLPCLVFFIGFVIVPMGIAKLQAEMATDFGLTMAGAALAAVPIIVVFLLFQKYFTQGITMGAVKG